MNKGSHISRKFGMTRVCILMLVSLAGGQERKITLQEAMDLALRQNRTVQIAHYGVAAEPRSSAANSPTISQPLPMNPMPSILPICSAFKCRRVPLAQFRPFPPRPSFSPKEEMRFNPAARCSPSR